MQKSCQIILIYNLFEMSNLKKTEFTIFWILSNYLDSIQNFDLNLMGSDRGSLFYIN